MKNTIKKIIWTLVGLIIAIVIIGGVDWVGEIDPRDPIISPIYGEMKGLPPTDLFTVTWEIFYADIVKTCDKMKVVGVEVHLHVAEKMGHVYSLWPCPEGSSARKEIAEIIMQ